MRCVINQYTCINGDSHTKKKYGVVTHILKVYIGIENQWNEIISHWYPVYWDKKTMKYNFSFQNVYNKDYIF